MSKKEFKYVICESCKGNGYITGKGGSTGTCIYCNGSGHKNHGTRINNNLFLDIIKYVEEYYIDDEKIEGWYH
jgi:DnaJ-class molecular chaperone